MVLIRFLVGALILACLMTSLLLWFLPASLVWKGIEADQHLPYGARVTLPRGTIREGYMTLRFRTSPPSKFSWTLIGMDHDGRSLALQYQLRFEGPNHAVDATVSIQPSRFNLIDVSGFIDSEDINRLAAPFGHQFSGRMNINLSSVQWNPPCIEAAAGQLDWTGGMITLSFFNQLSTYQLPALTSQVSANLCGLVLGLKRNRLSLGEFKLSSTGWFSASIEPELLQIAKIPNADQIKQPFLFEEKIL
jgi:hypothetical protein